MINSIILIFVIVLLVSLAGLFAGSEIGIYQLSRLRLRLGIERKRFSFIILGKIMDDSPALLISTIIGTNLTHYIITSIVTYILLTRLEVAHTAEFVATLITVPVLFVFAELIPKSVFFYRADTLMHCVAPVLFVFKTIFTWCGILPLLGSISGLFARLTGTPPVPKTAIAAMRQPHIKSILHDTREEGFLSPVQADIINRLADISHVSIKSVMTPINKTQTVDVASDNAVLLKVLKKSVFTRLPVYEHHPANIIGFINIYEVLSLPEQFADLHKFVKPIRNLPANTIVTDAINIMQGENQKIVLVTRTGHPGQEKPVGIVTMKDLVEELLGELAEW